MSEESRPNGEHTRRGVLSTLSAVSLLGVAGQRSTASIQPRVTADTRTQPATTSQSEWGAAWIQAYGTEEQDHIKAVTETSDGGYLAAGRTNDTEVGTEAWLVKTAADGTEKWTNAYDGPTNDELNDTLAAVTETSDGGYLAAGGTYVNRPPGEDTNRLIGYEGWLLKVAPRTDGTEQWSKFYGVDEFHYDTLAAVIETSDGDYLAAGTAVIDPRDELERPQGWLLKTAPDGTKLWSKPYGGKETETYSLTAVTELSDGGYLAAGHLEVPTPDRLDGWLLRTTEGGTVKWSKTYQAPAGEERAAVLNGVIETSDGAYLAVGTTGSVGLRKGWMLKTAPDGTERWSNSYEGQRPTNRADTLSAVIESSDGGYLAVGGTDPHFEELFDGWFVKTATDGTVQWTRTYGGKYNETLRAVTETSDGGYLAAGETFSFGRSSDNGWLVKLETGGRIANQFPTATFEYTISTRPVTVGDSVTFNAAASRDPDGEIALYEWDFNGEKTFNTQTTAEQVTHTYESPGTKSVRLRVTDDEGASATTASKVLTVRAVSVAIDGTNSPVTPGETLTVTATVENAGSASVTQTVRLLVGGQQRDATDVTLAAGATTTVTLSWATGSADAGSYTATVAIPVDTAEVAVSVGETTSGDIVAQYDEDDSGTIDQQELLSALANYGEGVDNQDLLQLLSVYEG